ncbi:hypothetical protein VNI00_013817 [Paramarasmius palmivorus]|uniref:Uncharacterized protein n=1 Tax=Paramarasmius palmivorus TaxID=297713 RepID=A0AAW0BY42_9AGAR
MLQTVLDSINTPALSHLALTIPLKNVVAEHAPFLGLVEVSNCIITSLELNMYLSSRALVEALQCVPFISTLHLTDVFQPPPYVTEEGVVARLSPFPILDSDVFRALSDNELCPSLENVTLKLCPIERIDDVVAFALARRAIKSLNVTFQMNDGVGSRPYGRLSDKEQEKGELIKRHGIKVEWHNTGFEGGFPGPLNNPLSSQGMPLSFSGIY